MESRREGHPIELQGVREVHIVGIGGAGMSAIARVLHGRGIRVHGSDRRSSPITAALRGEGIGVFIGHAAENIGTADLVLASSAVPDANVELEAARARNVATVRRPEFLPVLTAGYDVIGVAGAHGKTTVTAMIALILREAGLDPTYIVGGVVKDLGTNGYAGTGNYFVIEADEYRRTFLALRPAIGVVTNVEFDHPDCFEDLDAVKGAFEAFVGNIAPDGLLVVCGDDPVAAGIAARRQMSGGRVVRYGRSADARLDWRAVDLRMNADGGVSFSVERRGHLVGKLALRIPGAFNAVNALAALAVAEEVGPGWSMCQRALERFQGTARRFEVLGEVAGVTVIDDYAHHPTQIRGVLEATRARYGGRRIVAVWEPHTFSRIRALYGEFMDAFGEADRVMVLPIYAAREPDDGTLTSRDLALDLAHPDAWAASSLSDAVGQLAASVRPGDVVVLMGAGDEYLVGRQLLAALQEKSPRITHSSTEREGK